VSLQKLCAHERVARDAPGRYRLSGRSSVLTEQLRRWRRLEEQHRKWRGAWVAVHQPKQGSGPPRRRRERALILLGFRELDTGVFLRPDNLRGGVPALRARVVALAGADQPSTLVYGVSEFDPVTDRRARELWEVKALERGYRRLRDELARSRARLPQIGSEAAMVETFALGGQAIRCLIMDPLLPDAILDPTGRRELLEATRAYDELGRWTWAPFLERHGVSHRRAVQGWRATPGTVPGATMG
jgi:phenylacetic acid degradation operon negative regulatory protein